MLLAARVARGGGRDRPRRDRRLREPVRRAPVRLERVRGGRPRFDLTLSCAGHPLPLLLTAAGDVRSAGKPGMVVGLFEDPDLHDAGEQLAPGDALVLYTDGLLEARSPDGRFDAGLVENALVAAAGKSAEEIAASIERAVLRFEGGEPRDDMALLVLRVPA